MSVHVLGETKRGARHNACFQGAQGWEVNPKNVDQYMLISMRKDMGMSLKK